MLEADFRSSPLKANIRKSITSKVTNFRQRISSFQDKEAANQNQIELKNCGFNGNQKKPAYLVIHFRYNCIQLLNENKINGTSPFALENNASLIWLEKFKRRSCLKLNKQHLQHLISSIVLCIQKNNRFRSDQGIFYKIQTSENLVEISVVKKKAGVNVLYF